MKQVINGLTYNTETAEKIHNEWNGLSRSDFRHCDETLYYTKKGRFFLAGNGGPMSKYAQPAGNMTSGGSGIIPLSEAEALEWCETHGTSAGNIEKYFSVQEA